MGHVAAKLSSGQIFIHGGLLDNGKPASDMYLLTTHANKWSWSDITIDDNGVQSPNRTWHTAVSVGTDKFVVGYGLDSQLGQPSNDVFVLTRLTGSTFGWSTSHIPAVQVKSSSTPLPAPAPRTEPTSVAPVIPSQRPLSSIQTADWLTTSLPVVTAAAPTAYSDAASPASTATSKVVAGTIGGIFAFALLAGVIAMYLRRRAAQDEHNGSGTPSADIISGVPPVSALMFTRSVPKRTLSLGSTASGRSTESGKSMPDDLSLNDTLDVIFPRPTSAAFDDMRPSLYRSPASQASAAASVTSYPFLQAVPMMTGLSKSSHVSDGSDASIYSNDSAQPLQQPAEQTDASKPGWTDYLRPLILPRSTPTFSPTQPPLQEEDGDAQLIPDSPHMATSSALESITAPRLTRSSSNRSATSVFTTSSTRTTVLPPSLSPVVPSSPLAIPDSLRPGTPRRSSDALRIANQGPG